MQYKCLSIAGFDGSGGAGLQADLKTFSALGCYGMSVLTALPIQNTCGVRNCYDIPLKSIQEQLEAIFDDIPPSCIKIGMLFSVPIIELVAAFLKKHVETIPIVLDPVMVAKSGDPLLEPNAIDYLKEQLIPISSIITPNLPEASAITGLQDNMENMGKSILKLGAEAVLIKGGHNNSNNSDDIFMDQDGKKSWLRSERIHSKNTHGTGCTLSAAICAFIAQGFTVEEACKYSKKYLLNAIISSQENSVGFGHGPVHHFYHLWPSINKIVEGA